ncbi:PucR family transcriptional regulator [Streptomyces sp. NPDC007084]|uniref:PucR family transcriptional regulator n=1 Tax=Streptomyces sp. NPDC007084 TaxID=3154313 RepID=UPI0034540E32
MYVDHLLNDESLGLRLLWAEEPQLRQEISGVTATDLEDPARFVRPGEVVLSGLVWWSREDGADRAERFVSALSTAGAAVLLAGEETHGSVPDDLVTACRRHGLPVAAVPAHIMFRAITDTVYLQQWGELSRLQALPGAVRGRLNRLLAREAGPAAVLEAAFAHLGGARASVLTAAGRTVAATGEAAPPPAREAAALVDGGSGVTVPVDSGTVSPYERWYLHLPEADDVPPKLLREVAEVLARCQETMVRRGAAEQRAADELGALLALPPGAEHPSLQAALHACALDGEGPYRVIVAEAVPLASDAEGGARPVPAGLAEGALTETAAHLAPRRAVVGRLPDGTAFAVLDEHTPDPVAETAAVRGRGAGPGKDAAPAGGPGRAASGPGAGAGGGSGCAVPGPGAGAAGASARTVAEASAVPGPRRPAGPLTPAAPEPSAVWALLSAGEPGVALHGGTSRADGAEGLNGALAQARYALASARTTSPDASALTDAGSLTGLDTLLTGIPAEVRTAFSRSVLGPLFEAGNASFAALLETLEIFLACDGSWSRTAEALHLHVNTVHYRVQRVEYFTGRDLARLSDRLDLRAALLCRPRRPVGA